MKLRKRRLAVVGWVAVVDRCLARVAAEVVVDQLLVRGDPPLQLALLVEQVFGTLYIVS